MSSTTPGTTAGRPGSAESELLDRAAINEHVARILGSAPFARAPKMQRFLAFLVEETLAGRASQLKEYTIAVTVFRKPVDFEPGTSATVRVEAGRLRKLLMQYRVEHGGSDAIIVEVPKGSYVPTFRHANDEKAAVDRRLDAVEQIPSWSTREERRLVTVLSCALGDERSVSRSSIAEEFLDSFDVFHEQCTAIAQQHGGTVDCGASDRLIVYFGWLNAVEDAAGRALTAAVEMLASVQGTLRARGLGVRLGVATSEVVTRGAGPAPASTRAVIIGEAPASVMKLLLKAPLNAILVAESTRRLTGAAFDFIPAGSLDDQEAEPHLLWRLLRPKTALTRFRAKHAGSRSAIIGRREEAALITSRWQLSLQSEGQGVVVVGEAGIGKSKLVEAALERVADQGAQIRVQCSPHHTNSTLYPFVELLRNQLDADIAADVPRQEQLDGLLASYGSSDPLDQALLATLLSQSGDEALSTLSASQQKDLTLQLLSRLLRVQVERRPTVLLVEDVHWADPTSIELLQDILRMAGNIQLLVLLTSRYDLQPACTQQTNVTSIRLTRLPKQDCNDLIDSMLSAALLSAPSRSLILEKAEGIPLFLEELTKLFLAADSNRLQDASIPESLSDLLASQLDRLGSPRSVAQVAAVIGRQFSKEMLALASGHAQQIDTALDQLVAAGVMVRQGAATSNLFSFRHALLRDAAYGSILEHSRRELHYKVAGLLVDAFPEIAAGHPEIIAGHLMDATRYEEAIPFWIDAGRKAASRYALAEAIADFRRALQALQALPDTRENRERELEVLIDLGLVIRHARGYGDEELQSIYQRGRVLAAELGKQEQLASVIYGLWTHAAGRGEWRTAARLATEFESLSRRTDDDSQLEVEAFRLLGASAAFTGEFAIARRHFERALSIYDVSQHGPRFGFDPGAASAAYLSWTAWHLGHRDEARSYAARALVIGEAKNHASTLAMVLSWLMFYEVCDENVEAITVYNDRLQAVCSERDCRYWQPFGAACAEWAAFQRDADARHLERLLEAATQFREHYLTSCLLLMGADICKDLRRAEHGLQLVAKALQFIEAHDERVWEAECSRLTGELLLLGPRPEIRRARKLLLRAIKTARHQEALELEQRAVASLAALDAAAGAL
jgi:class 3 adenylate cyclase/ABC-type transport system involved in cytochrome c biogenesis ATPase subunit